MSKIAVTAHEIKRALRRQLERERNGSSRAWAVFEELRFGSGFQGYASAREEHEETLRVATTIDVFALNTWPSKSFLRRAYEIKVDKQDLKHELEDPGKRAPWFSVINEFFFVIPRAWGDAGLSHAMDAIADKAPECGVIVYDAPPDLEQELRDSECECGTDPSPRAERRGWWLHGFGCPVKDAGRAWQSGKNKSGLRVARPAPKHDGGEPSWRLVASILRAAAR